MPTRTFPLSATERRIHAAYAERVKQAQQPLDTFYAHIMARYDVEECDVVAVTDLGLVVTVEESHGQAE